MEMYGFARSRLPGEYSPTLAYAELTENVASSSTVYVELVSCDFYVTGPNETVVLYATTCVDCLSSGNTPFFQITVDGTQVAFAFSTMPAADGFSANYPIATVTGLRAGRHTARLNFHSSNTNLVRCLVVTDPFNYHATLVVVRDQVLSDQEMGGYVPAAFPVIYSCGTLSNNFLSGGTLTDSSASPTVLAGTFKITTHTAQSSLMLRLTATGKNVGAANTVNTSPRFIAYVDGVYACGTGDASCSGNPNLRFNAGMICVVPAQAGEHTISLYWCGGTNTSVMDPADSAVCFMTAQEVFCVDTISNTSNVPYDMEGFATKLWYSKNIPQVRYLTLTTNFIPIDSSLHTINSMYISVDAEQSLFVFEATCADVFMGAVLEMYLYVDSTYANAVTLNYGASSTNPQFGGLSKVIALTPGVHLIELRGRVSSGENGTGLVPGVVPGYSHCNMVIREMGPV